METIPEQSGVNTDSEKPVNQESNKLREIGLKLTSTGQRLLEYSKKEAEAKDLIPVMIAAGLIQLGVAAGLSGHANALMELSANLTLPQRLTHLGLSNELVDEAFRVQRFADVLPALVVVEVAATMVGSKIEEFNEKIGLSLKELPVSTIVFPAAAKSLMFVGRLFNS